jgi:hypothetical protein
VDYAPAIVTGKTEPMGNAGQNSVFFFYFLDTIFYFQFQLLQVICKAELQSLLTTCATPNSDVRFLSSNEIFLSVRYLLTFPYYKFPAMLTKFWMLVFYI